MFEVGGEYSNRIGRYRVLEVNDDKMTVEYENGRQAELSIRIQSRIWENIVAEEEARSTRATKKANRKSSSTKNGFFIKPIMVLAAEEVITPGRQGKVEASKDEVARIKSGDRIIYYAVDSQVLFAVVTITGNAAEVKSSTAPKGKVIYQFPVDVDVFAPNLDKAVQISSVELESQSNVQATLERTGEFTEISEDDFELMAELLTELAEEDDELDDDDDEDDEYDD